ncbi:MAG: FHA domain-containing protein [Bradymonadales bacterium]|nr:MAG: FHA domain-containing protein [Bradymonadales bacterium]
MAVKLSISITEGPEKGMHYEFESGPIFVGRRKGDISLSDKKVSGKHCQFLIEGNRVWIEDLNSTNGTFLGGSRLTEKVPLSNLDVVTIGLTRLSIAIVEDLETFKEMNQMETVADRPSHTQPAEPDTGDGSSEEDSKTPSISLPDPDAVYRDTGVERIENLIDDELESFSKWDHPKMQDSENPQNIPKVDVRLIKRKGEASFQELKCQKPLMTFGRKDVDIRINDLDLSRKHARLEIVNGQKVFVRDMASTNGTFVNGQRIRYQELHHGDLIQIGQNIFEVFIREA